MVQILLEYNFSKETVTTIIIYKNMKAMVLSLDGDTDFFNIVAGVLQGITLVLYWFIICLYCEIQALTDLIKENGFAFKKDK